MANRWKGNIVAAAATTSSGTDYTGKANGAWGLNSQLQQKQGGLWAKGVSVPSAPTIETAVYGDASATVSFTAPSDTGGQTITSYIATSSPSGITASNATSPITITGLTNGTTYTFTVAAVNASGTGASSFPSNSVTPSSLTVPDAPAITNVAQSGEGTVTITFTAPSFNGGSPITSYRATSSGGQTNSINQSGGGTITVSGLTILTAYTFTMTATNAIGTSSPSSPSSSITIQLAIGQSYGGGYYAGKISTAGNGVANYYLIVAPKASGENSSRSWGVYGVDTGQTSVINGPTNSANLAALGANYQAAVFCEGLTIGGYSDWYLPALNELEVLYYFLKPTTDTNNTLSGSNVNAVSPEPASTNYTSGSPAQTSAGIGFRVGESNAFASSRYWSSTESDAYAAYSQLFTNGQNNGGDVKATNRYVRAIRRIPV